MSDLIDKLLDLGSDAFKQQAKYVQMFKSMKHNKEDLENFLRFNVVRLKFVASDNKVHEIICTSNTPLIKMFTLVKESDIKKASKLENNGIHTRHMDSIDTWDLIENKLKTISLKNWKIDVLDPEHPGFVTLTEDNVMIVHGLINKILKRK